MILHHPLKDLLCIALLHICICSKAMLPNDSIQYFANTINRFNKFFPQEKVYLHLDNTGYFMGETLWFKAYVIRTDNDSLQGLSHVLYVELVSPMGDVVKSQKIKIERGMGNGEFELADLLVSGYYEIRAYTRYMLNWGNDAIFSRVIPIFEQPIERSNYSKPVLEDSHESRLIPQHRDAPNDNDSEKLNIKFFPEGGKMVKNLDSRVAFTLTDKQGRPVDASCELLDRGRVIKSFTTVTEGRGSFDVMANGRKSLRVRYKNGKIKEFNLPEGEVSGCVLHVDVTSDESVALRLIASDDMWGKKIGIVWLQNGKMHHCEEATLHSKPIELKRDKKFLKGGVHQITIIDDAGKILAHRQVFIYPKKGEIASIAVDPLNTETLVGGKQLLKVKTLPNVTFSMSICNADNMTNGWAHDAATWYLLTSDIKGYIKNPEYYLESDDLQHRQAADLLMMVQGWRRYDFQMMEGKKTFHKDFALEDKLYIDGKLFQAKRKKTVDNVLLSVMLTNNMGDRLLGQTYTNEKGYFAFSMPDCYRDWYMVISTVKDDKFIKYNIGINRHFSPSVRPFSLEEVQPIEIPEPRLVADYRTDEGNALGKFGKTYTLQEVKVYGKRWRNPKDFWQRESVGAVDAAILYDCEKDADDYLDQGQDVPSLVDYLRGKNEMITGNDNISGISNYARLKYNFYTDGLSYNRRPIIWIVNNKFFCCTSSPSTLSETPKDDELPYETAAPPFPVSLDEVKRVYISFGNKEVRRFQRVMPELGLMGKNFVSIYVYTYPSSGVKPMKGIRITHFEGFNVAKEYETEKIVGILPEKDYRRTLYWNPNVKTNENGETTIEFLPSPSSERMFLSAEGFSVDGKPLIYQ